jgi:hypothetical protein
MKIPILIAGSLAVACSLSAHAQDPIAGICAEFLAPEKWPEPMSEDERTALEASIMENAVSVAEMVNRLPDTLETVEVSRTDFPSREEWQNPVVTVTVEGVEVRSSALESGSLDAPVGALQCVLTNLPDSAWPHGRVLRAGPLSNVASIADIVPIGRNHKAAEAIFDELRIEVLWWAM